MYILYNKSMMDSRKINRGLGEGFTLIESLMVIVIIGILAALAIPRFNSFYAIKFNGALKKVVSDIRFVQQIAVSRHTNARLVFNTGSETYVAEEESPQGSGAWINITDPFTRGNLQMNFATNQQYKGIDITSVNIRGSNTLRFTWEGVPQNASGSGLLTDGLISLSYKGNSNTIHIIPDTGMVSVQ